MLANRCLFAIVVAPELVLEYNDQLEELMTRKASLCAVGLRPEVDPPAEHLAR